MIEFRKEPQEMIPGQFVRSEPLKPPLGAIFHVNLRYARSKNDTGIEEQNGTSSARMSEIVDGNKGCGSGGQVG